MARNGADRFLIDTFHSMYSTFQEQVKVFSMNKSSGNPMTPENLAEIAKEKVILPNVKIFIYIFVWKVTCFWSLR